MSSGAFRSQICDRSCQQHRRCCPDLAGLDDRDWAEARRRAAAWISSSPCSSRRVCLAASSSSAWLTEYIVGVYHAKRHRGIGTSPLQRWSAGVFGDERGSGTGVVDRPADEGAHSVRFSALNAIQTDPQLANRFEPILLRRWTMGEDYLRLLDNFEVAPPLEHRSGLVEPELAIKILSLSEGTIGEISALLCRATLDAIERSTEQIRAPRSSVAGTSLPPNGGMLPLVHVDAVFGMLAIVRATPVSFVPGPLLDVSGVRSFVLCVGIFNE